MAKPKEATPPTVAAKVRPEWEKQPDVVVHTAEGSLVGEIKTLRGGDDTEAAIVLFLQGLQPPGQPVATRRRVIRRRSGR